MKLWGGTTLSHLTGSLEICCADTKYFLCQTREELKYKCWRREMLSFRFYGANNYNNEQLYMKISMHADLTTNTGLGTSLTGTLCYVLKLQRRQKVQRFYRETVTYSREHYAQKCNNNNHKKTLATTGRGCQHPIKNHLPVISKICNNVLTNA
jgi:hypothetical protein